VFLNPGAGDSNPSAGVRTPQVIRAVLAANSACGIAGLTPWYGLTESILPL